ncbi:hypothetical protein K4F52_003922 [Lecanicillium sp. MT-2017a]|nr:hypothetical protein K4F52_003922 [Lecanicillium sp. MT-2017a]
MKAAIFSLAALCIAPAFGAAAATPTEDTTSAAASPTQVSLLPDFKEILVDKCGIQLGFSCPKAIEALEPYNNGEKEFDLNAILVIGKKIKEDPDCKKELPPCAGKVIQAALSEILDVPDTGCSE